MPATPRVEQGYSPARLRRGRVASAHEEDRVSDHNSTISIDSSVLSTSVPDPTGASEAGDLTPELIATDVWSDETVTQAGIPVYDVPLVSVGGGIGLSLIHI